MRRLGLLVLVAACNPPGLTIEVVVDDPSIVKVELYAGRDCGSECPRVTVPPGLPLMRVDGAYFIDDPQPFYVGSQDFSNGVAGFRIEADQDATLDIVAVIGFDAQQQVRWSWSRRYVEIPNGGSAHWQVHLDDASMIGPTISAQPPGTERVALWPSPQNHAACLLLEHWNYDGTATRELLGPVDDPDCDNVLAANECAPWIPNAKGAAPTLEEASCVTSVEQGSAYVCMIGGRECNEDPLAPRQDCVPVEPRYCAPTSVCQCAGTVNATDCIRTQLVMGTNDSTMPHVKCLIRVDANGYQCDADRQLEIDLGAVLSGGSRKCTAIQVNDGDPGLQLGQGWHIGAGKLYFDSFTQPCKTNVTWEGGTAPPINYSVVDASIDNGFHLLLPIRVDFKPGCLDGGDSLCTYVPSSQSSESMFNCVDAVPVVPGVCSPNPEKGCFEGPECNGTCCASGDICTPQGCRCGVTNTRCDAGDTCQARFANPDQCGEVCCGLNTPCPF